MQFTGQQKSCVACGQALPGNSKLTSYCAPSIDAARNNWPGKENADGTITVAMCLQCQITRSRAPKVPSPR